MTKFPFNVGDRVRHKDDQGFITFVDEKPRIPGKLPEYPVATDSFVESKSYEYAADITLSDIARFQRGSSL